MYDILRPYKGHIMDKAREFESGVFSKILDQSLHVNAFGKNRSGDRAYRRAERIVAAIFLATNHILGEEPLKMEIRRVALSVLSEIIHSRHELRSSVSATVSDVQTTIRHLIALTRMMVFGALISPQNAEMIVGAADDLGSFILNAQRSPLSEKVLFSKNDFLETAHSYKGHLRDIKDNRVIKDTSSVRDNHGMSLTAPSNTARATSVRSESIMSILRGGVELSIRDIAANLPEYSEKTIQRELNMLIEGGMVKRTGLKRWSRYSLTSVEESGAVQ